MDVRLEKYLNKIDRHLKPLPISERIDIVREIKSSMIEMENDDLSVEQIIERLGKPDDLARAYLSDLLSKDNHLNLTRILTICAFYSLVGLSGMFIIPTLIIIAPTFIICGILSPILGLIKMIDYIFHLGIPYVEHIGIVLTGIIELDPISEFIGTLIIGILLYYIDHLAWKTLLLYCQQVSKTKRNLSI